MFIFILLSLSISAGLIVFMLCIALAWLCEDAASATGNCEERHE